MYLGIGSEVNGDSFVPFTSILGWEGVLCSGSFLGGGEGEEGEEEEEEGEEEEEAAGGEAGEGALTSGVEACLFLPVSEGRNSVVASRNCDFVARVSFFRRRFLAQLKAICTAASNWAVLTLLLVIAFWRASNSPT